MESSAGIVLFCKKKKSFLLLHYAAGHWSFPKGHLEGRESDRDAALRELQEETGIPSQQISFVENFMEKISYFYTKAGKKVFKNVSFFLATTESELPVKTSFEHQSAAWLPLQKALEKTTFENDRKVLRKAAQAVGV